MYGKQLLPMGELTRVGCLSQLISDELVFVAASSTRRVFCTLSLFKTPISTEGKSKGEGGGSPGRGKGEGPRENLQKVRVLRIQTGVGVVPSRVF